MELMKLYFRFRKSKEARLTYWPKKLAQIIN
jgi:hypothetical protein